MSAVSDAYAAALFELALEDDRTDAVHKAFSAFVASVDRDVTHFFMHPNIAKEAKKKTLQDIEPELFKDFLCVLVDNNRFDRLREIEMKYRSLHEEEQRTMPLRVTSKTPLSEARKDALKKAFEDRYRVRVTLENVVDTSLLGGLRFEYRGLVVDETVDERLIRLKAHLKA